MDRIKKCVFCQKELLKNFSYKNNIYYCFNDKCKKHYVEIHYEENDVSQIYAIHIASIRLFDNKKYRIMYKGNFLKVYFSNSEQLICNIDLSNGKSNFPITPDNCQAKLSNYLLYL